MKNRILFAASLIVNVVLLVMLGIYGLEKRKFKEELTFWIAHEKFKDGSSVDALYEYLGEPDDIEDVEDIQRITYISKSRAGHKDIITIDGCVFNIISNRVERGSLILSYLANPK